VDYGLGPRTVALPHAWKQDVPVGWEGPAIYRTSFTCSKKSVWLVFHGVSCQARVFLNNRLVKEHCGIWDAFSISLENFVGSRVEVKVEVVKNGGPTFPVDQVASGFLPYVFNTFGGIYREVELVTSESDPLAVELAAPDIRVEGSKIFVNGKPFYARGVLTWGWYPELGHPNAPEETIRREIAIAKKLGFNLIKFCLWVPLHRYLELLKENGMFAWMELPLWNPTSNVMVQQHIADELKRIVEQYRGHQNILFWTVGCELGGKVSARFRNEMVRMVKKLTGSALVKDDSGSAEMYGGDPREYGDFYDFHPYCETEFYPPVLDSLLPGARIVKPLLLGEFNDCDLHRHIPRLQEERPYWTSEDENVNAKGVRWQYDLPRIIASAAFSEERQQALLRSSRSKALFMRKFVQEAVRARDQISGYVVTGWRDTPISSSGMLDDWGEPRFSKADLESWNSSACLFLIPQRQPPWLAGGNRPGWQPLFCYFTGQIVFRVGVHSERRLHGALSWDLVKYSWGRPRGKPSARLAEGECEERVVDELTSREVGEIHVRVTEPGGYLLRVQFGGAHNTWPIWVYEKPDFAGFAEWHLHDPAALLSDISVGNGPNHLTTVDTRAWMQRGNMLLFMHDTGTLAKPFWRESVFEFADKELWKQIGWEERWEQFLSVSTDRVIDPHWMKNWKGQGEVLLNRLDVRTYEEHAVMIRMRIPEGMQFIATTLRPFGGLGICPPLVSQNPAGAHLLTSLLKYFDQNG